jgi:aspartate kinase
MSTLQPVVVKLGGDALATPERIVAAARRLARLAVSSPVIAVTSARRGVTDHLLGLVQEVRQHTLESSTPRPDASSRGTGLLAEADRAVATGEVVTAALLALALNELGVEALSLDAREAGVRSTGRHGGARIQAISTGRLRKLLASGVVPVVTGFQGWQRGRVATLGRGGTDTSAVALAVAVAASRCIFVKDAEGLRTADPRIVPDAQPIREVSHAFLSALTAAGSEIVQADAARLAQLHGLRLEFHSLTAETPTTIVDRDARSETLRAVATLVLSDSEAQVTTVAGRPDQAAEATETLREALLAAAIDVRDIQPAANGPRFIVGAGQAVAATRVLHQAFAPTATDAVASSRRAS